MDDKIKEIEERMEDGHWRQREDIKYLLSKIKELEEELDKIRRTQDYFINKPQTD